MNHGFLGLLDFTDYLALGDGWGFESGFTGFRGFFSVGCWLGRCVMQLLSSFFSNHFYILSPIKLWDNRVLSCSLVLNQDLQDFEDFLALGVGMEF